MIISKSIHVAANGIISFFFFFKDWLIDWLIAMLGLHFCARAFSSCSKWGPLFIAVHGPLTIVASLVAEHRLQTWRLSSCGSRTQLLRGMWDPPRPGLEPVSPALAGRLSSTAPPGKPYIILSYGWVMYHIFFIHSSLDGHLGCFHILAIVKTAAMNIGVYVSFLIRVFSSYLPRSRIPGSYGSSIFSF